eukprot:6194649-Pleurochrysis_carterae.AAC.7
MCPDLWDYELCPARYEANYAFDGSCWDGLGTFKNRLASDAVVLWQAKHHTFECTGTYVIFVWPLVGVQPVAYDWLQLVLGRGRSRDI